MKLEKFKNVTDKMRKYQDYQVPQPVNKNLPPTYSIFLSSSVKGAGKSYNCVLLLQEYEKEQFVASDGTAVKMRTIWVSGGTSRSKQNAILDTLDSLHDKDRIDLEDNVDEGLKNIYSELLDERDRIESYQEYIRIYNKYIKSVKGLTYEELLLLDYKNHVDPRFDPEHPVDENGHHLHNPRMVYLVLDDMIGGDGFSNNKRGNFLNKLAIKSRHSSDKLVGLNLFFISQSFKAIPKIIRAQTDIFILLKSASKSYIIDAIAEEIGGHFGKEELEVLYNDVMQVKFGALILSLHKKELPENRVRLNWDQRIIRDAKYLI